MFNLKKVRERDEVKDAVGKVKSEVKDVINKVRDTEEVKDAVGKVRDTASHLNCEAKDLAIQAEHSLNEGLRVLKR
ncbi:MAG: hypothetical protein WCB98_03430 [Candidatus Aquirickettsiella gammari]